ncbi:MAG: multidrug ABC transporter ATPase [Microbacterium sp.]
MSPRTKNPATPDEPVVRRIDRILAFMSLGIIVLSIVCFLSIIIATAAGADKESFTSPVWLMVSAITWIGPIIGFLLLAALLVMSFVRRARQKSQGAH